EAETIEQVAAYVTHRRPYAGRAYLSYDFRPEMSAGQRAVCEDVAAFLLALQDREYLVQAERDELDTRRERLVAAWRALPLAPAWEQRSVCDEVVRQVFDLLICQMYFPGRRFEVWARAPHRLMMDTTQRPHPDLLALVPWGRRAVGALMGTALAQLS